MPEPLLLDRFIPRYDHSVVHSQVFRALPEKCFEALVNMTLASLDGSSSARGLGPNSPSDFVSKPWEPVASVPAEAVTAERFAGFNEAGFAKIAESTRVDPYGERFSIVTVESRVCLTGVNSRRRFRRYWLLLGPFMRLMRPTLMRARRSVNDLTSRSSALDARRCGTASRGVCIESRNEI